MQSSGLPWLAPKKTLGLGNLTNAICEVIGVSILVLSKCNYFCQCWSTSKDYYCFSYCKLVCISLFNLIIQIWYLNCSFREVKVWSLKLRILVYKKGNWPIWENEEWIINWTCWYENEDENGYFFSRIRWLIHLYVPNFKINIFLFMILCVYFFVFLINGGSL